MRSSKVAWRVSVVASVIWCLFSTAACKTLEGIGSVTSVKGLQQEMYRQQKGSGGAYMLLNATDRIGSQGSSDPMVNTDAPLVRYSDLTPIMQRDVAVLLPVKQSVEFMQKLRLNKSWQQQIKGVLIDDSDPPDSYSTVGTFPLAEYAPYSAPEYVWNEAAGSNAYPFSTTWFPMPVLLLSPELAVDAQQRAAYNAKQDPHGEQYHAAIKLTMASHAAANSVECITSGTCKPLGGHSVWSAVPPVPAEPTSDARPIILVVAQMDSIDMFHDSVQGADGPLSGLTAVLGALSLLHTMVTAAGSSAASSYSKRIVFLALAGEPWGYMGSRRLLYEVSIGSNSTAGLDFSLVEKVIEVGQVGRLLADKDGAVKLYAHSQKGPGFADTSETLAALTAAAQAEASSAQATVQAASASNPGIPPASLMSFLRVNSSIQGVVLAEYDTGFANVYYSSRFDNGSTISAAGVASTAAVLAGTLHRLAGGDPTAFKVNMTELHKTISGYISCMVMPIPGFSCPLAATVMSPDYVYNTATGIRSYAPKHYIGVLQYLPGLNLPAGKGNMARFLWNVMAFDSSDGVLGASCDPYKMTCPVGQVCAGWRGSSQEKYMGRCVNATVRYVPSYSTKLTCQSCEDNWRIVWQLTDDADAWNQQHKWPSDPIWTESDWPMGIPDLQLYLRESDTVQVAVLIAGLAATAIVTVASLSAKSAFHKHHKSS